MRSYFRLMRWASYFAPLAVLLASVDGTIVAVDETLGKAMCKQMTDYKKNKEIQPALKNQDDFPEHEGCAWIHWSKCPTGKDCSTFSKQACPGGGGGQGPPPGGPSGPGVSPGSYKATIDLDGTQMCYIMDTTAKMNQEGAEGLCKKSNGALVAIETVKENAMVGAILLTHGDIAAQDFWTSASVDKKTWKSTGKAFEYTDPTLDKSQGSGPCMTVSWQGGALHWNKKPCESYFPLCEVSGPCPATPPDPVPPEQPSPLGKGISKMMAEYDDRKICFVVDTATQVSSDKAESYCSSKGFGHSVSIETQNEQAIIDVLLQSYGIQGDGFWTSADLKGNKWKGSGTDISYKNEPFSTSKGGDCMTIVPQGGKSDWQSEDCGSNHYVFCEAEGDCDTSGGGSGEGGGGGEGGGTPPPPTGGGGGEDGHSWLSMTSEVDGVTSCYLIDSSGAVSMEKAKEMCKAESNAGLLSIESENENKIVEALLSSGDGGDAGYWTSADLSQNPQKWTSTGKDLTYSDPSMSQGSGTCLSVSFKGGKISWAKTDCSSGKSFAFCEREGECGKVDSGSGDQLPEGVVQMKATIDGTSKCYTTKSPAKDCVDDAENFCSSGGFGHLVSIETEEEQLVVRGLLQSTRISRDGDTELGYWTSGDLSSNPPKWTATGKAFEYTNSNFQKGSDQKCMIVVLKGDDASEWQGVACDTEHLILCEADGDCAGSSGGGGGGGEGDGDGDGAGNGGGDGAGNEGTDGQGKGGGDGAGEGGGDGAGEGGDGDGDAASSKKDSDTAVDESPPSGQGDGGGSAGLMTPGKGSGAGHVHISGTLSKGICEQMKAFKSSKKVQEPLDDKDKYASGSDSCNWYQWHQCQSRGDCSKFHPKSCDEVEPKASSPNDIGGDR